MKTGELSPLLAEGKAVDWWSAFKFNAATFPGDESRESNPGIFVGMPRDGTPFSHAKVGVSLAASARALQ